MSSQTTQGILAHAHVHPTVSVTDIARAKDFYANRLGLPIIEEDEMGGIRLQAADTQVYVYERPDPPKAENTVASFEVEFLDETMQALREAGVTFEEYDMPQLKTVNGVFDTGSRRGAWFKDPDGNTFGLFEKPA